MRKLFLLIGLLTVVLTSQAQEVRINQFPKGAGNNKFARTNGSGTWYIDDISSLGGGSGTTTNSLSFSSPLTSTGAFNGSVARTVSFDTTWTQARFVRLNGAYSNPGWIISLAAGKVTGLSTVATTGDYNDLSNKPTIPTVTGTNTGDETTTRINSLYGFTITNPNLKEPAVTGGTTGQYYRGDKSFQTLDKTAVGLGNVDNTSDANKPVSTPQQTALNLKTGYLDAVQTRAAQTAVAASGTNDYNAFGEIYNCGGTLRYLYRSGTNHLLAGVINMINWDQTTNTWSSPTTIASDGTYDVRAPTGGVVGGDKMLMFTTFYNTSTSQSQNIGYQLSTDLTGTSWGARTTVTLPGSGLNNFNCFGPLIYSGSGGVYYQTAFGTNGTTYYLFMFKVTYSGGAVTSVSRIDIANSTTVQFTESSMVKVGTNYIILSRDELSNNVYQFTSTAPETTWTGPTVTNIGTSGNAGYAIMGEMTTDGNQIYLLYQDRLDGWLKVANQDINGYTATGWEIAKYHYNWSIRPSGTALGYPGIIAVPNRSGVFLTTWTSEAVYLNSAAIYSRVATLSDLTSGVPAIANSYAKLSGGNTISGTQTFSGVLNVNGATVLGSDGLAVGAGARIIRSAASPFFNYERTGTGANANQVGSLGTVGLNSAAARIVFSALNFYSSTYTSGSEEGELRVTNYVAGAATDVLFMKGRQLGSGITPATGVQFHNLQSTLGNPVVRWESTAPTNNIKSTLYQNKATTTDATVTTLHTFPTATDVQYTLRATVTAKRTGGAAGAAGDGASYIIAVRAKNVGGTVTIGTPVSLLTDEDQSGWDVTFSVSGTNVLVRVTGAASNNISWSLNSLETNEGNN